MRLLTHWKASISIPAGNLSAIFPQSCYFFSSLLLIWRIQEKTVLLWATCKPNKINKWITKPPQAAWTSAVKIKTALALTFSAPEHSTAVQIFLHHARSNVTTCLRLRLVVFLPLMDLTNLYCSSFNSLNVNLDCSEATALDCWLKNEVISGKLRS